MAKNSKILYTLNPECTLSLRVDQINRLNVLIESDRAVDLEPVEGKNGEYNKCPVCEKWFSKGNLPNFCCDCGQRFTGKVRDYTPFEEMEG